MAEQLIHPAFPQAALDRMTANAVTGLRRQKDQPNYIAGRILANVVYGCVASVHPHVRPRRVSARSRAMTSSRSTTQLLSAAEHLARRSPGDITADQAAAHAETAFARWEQLGPKASVDIIAPRGSRPRRSTCHDRPGSPQSLIVTGHLGPRRDVPEYFALSLMNTALGGAFNSRLNLNLREQRHFTYGAGSSFSYRPVPRSDCSPRVRRFRPRRPTVR